MPYLQIGSASIYYEEHGKGPPLVFVHGAGGNHMSWWQQAPAFSRDRRCILIDQRGWGFSVDGHDLGPGAWVDDLRALLDALDIERASLVGHSVGGLTCLGLALAQPERVTALVMANSFAGMRRAVWLAAPEDLRINARALWERRRSRAVPRVTAPGFVRRERTKAFLYKQIRLLNEQGPNRLRKSEQVLRARALERDPEAAASPEALAAMRTPVLFIGGEHDEVMPPALMAVARDLIPNAGMDIVPGAGHSVFFEAPDTFNRLVRDFLDCNGG